MKKLTSLILSFSMLAGSCSFVYAEKYSGEQTAYVMKSLGMTSDNVYTSVTRERLLKTLSYFLFENPAEAGTTESIARNTGMLKSGEEYKGNATVTTEDALRFAVILLGYGAVTGDGNYMGKAAQLGLTEGISTSGGYLRREDFHRLVFNITGAEPMVKDFATGEYYIATDETLLSMNRDIYKVEGVVTATDETSVYSSDGVYDGYIRIDEEDYEIADGIDYSGLLGRKVISYVRMKNGENQVVYIGEQPGENSELEIKDEDIEAVKSDFSAIEYTYNNKTKTAKLDNALKVIYNGKFCPDYVAEDLIPETGSIRLVDNDGNGRYNLVFINDFETVVVQSVSLYDSIIYNKYDSPSAIDLDENEPEYIIYKGDTQIQVSDLKVNDILSVARSRNGSGKIIRIYVSDTTLSGTVTSINLNELTVQINDTEYDISPKFMMWISKNGKTLNLGDSGTFYLDKFGNVSEFEKTFSDDYSVVFKVLTDDDENYYLAYMDLEEYTYKSQLAKKVKINGVSYTADKAYTSKLKGIKPQIMKLSLNSNGEIYEIETAKLSASYSEDEFTKTSELEYSYRASFQGFQNKYFLDEGAKIVMFPADGSTDPSDYAVLSAGGFFKGDKGYKFVAYDIDKFGFTKLFSMTSTTDSVKSGMSRNMFIITDISDCLNSDGEMSTKISGNMSIYRDFEIVSETPGIFGELKKGDVVNVSVNQRGEANYVEKLFSLGGAFTYLSEDDFYNDHVIVAGDVVDIEGNRVILDGGETMYFRLNTSTPATVYYADENRCEGAKTSDICKGDKIVMRVGWGMPAEVIILR